MVLRGRRDVRAPASAGAVLLLAGLFGSWARLDAQSVRGRLVDSRSGAPISGAFVVLLDQRGGEITRGLTGDSGTFLLQAPEAGVYRLQSKRIGFRLFESPLLVLAPGQTLDYELKVEAVRTLLPMIVEGRPQCGSRGDEASAAAQLWEEIQEALRAVQWTEREAAHYYTIQLYDRELEADERTVLSERTWARSGYTIAPFASIPAELLLQVGYIVPGAEDTLVFYAPDADVLLGDMFTNTHCFWARPGGPERSGLVGVAFEPVPSRRVADVRGVLWMEAGTLRLRVLEFTYTRPPLPLPQYGLSGRVEFMPITNGAWVVSRWWIRMARMVGSVMAFPDAMPTFEPRVIGFRESGGQVMTIASGRSVLYAADRAILAGTVVDSSRGGSPLSGAWVALRGTGREVRADSRGRFELLAPFDGTYAVTFRHPRLDSVGIDADPLEVTLTRGSRSSARLAVPTEERIVRRLCPRGLRPGARVVVGTVRDAGIVMPNAGVQLSWLAIGAEAVPPATVALEAVTDSVGRFVLCGVPSGGYSVVATAGSRHGRPVVLEFSQTGLWVDRTQFRSLRERIWKQDLDLLP